MEVPVSVGVPRYDMNPSVDMDIPIPDVKVPLREYIPVHKEKIPETSQTSETEVKIPAGINIQIPVVDRDFIVNVY